MTREEFDSTRWYNCIKVREQRAKIDVCIDWLTSVVMVISLLMAGFSAFCEEYLVAASFATTLVNTVLVMLIRKEAKK